MTSLCVLCSTDGGAVVYSHPKFRVVVADEPLYPGFLRLIWTDHVREFSQLSADDRMLCMSAVVVLERFVIETFHPTKVNIASLGNVVPHLHWHVIPRFQDDAHFPAPVWSVSDKPSGLLCELQAQILASRPDWTKALHACLNAAFSTSDE